MARFSCPHCGVYKSDKTSNYKRHVSTCASSKLDHSMTQPFSPDVSQTRGFGISFNSQMMTPSRMLEAPQAIKIDEDQDVKTRLNEENDDTEFVPRKAKKRNAEIETKEPRHPRFSLAKDMYYARIFDSPNSNTQSTIFPTPAKLDNDHLFSSHSFDPTGTSHETMQLRKRLQDAEMHVERLQAQLFECNALVRSLSERQQHAASILLAPASQVPYGAN